jgi:hypothetical protein
MRTSPINSKATKEKVKGLNESKIEMVEAILSKGKDVARF